MTSNMPWVLEKTKARIALFYTSRLFLKTIKLYGGVDRSQSILLSTCHYQVVNKNIELHFSHEKSKEKIVFEAQNDRSGIARLLSPCYYQGTYCLDNSMKINFMVSSLSPYIQVKYDQDEITLSSPALAYSTDIKYIISSKKYGILIHLFSENIYTLKETIASRAGLGLIALGTLETTQKMLHRKLKASNIFDILSVMLFIYLIIFPIIKSDESDGYS